VKSTTQTDLERLVDGADFGYWMRTGNKPTNDGTGQRYEEVFHESEMNDERRIISHAKNDKSIDRVVGKDGEKYSIGEAYEKKIDWIQIDIGFLTEQEKQTILTGCKYVVINGSHTIMGEIMGIYSKPIAKLEIGRLVLIKKCKENGAKLVLVVSVDGFTKILYGEKLIKIFKFYFRSKRSRFITFVHADIKSARNLGLESSQA